MIKELNRQLGFDSTDEDIKKFLLEKKEKTEESQESKQNSQRVKVGQRWTYETENGKTQVGEISNTQGEDGKNVDDVILKITNNNRR